MTRRQKAFAAVGALLSSRKSIVGVAGVVAALAARFGLDVSEELAIGILGLAAVVIHAIGREDAALKTGLTPAEWDEFQDKKA